ncbi:hypothetical protein Leryth_007971 [Lithospermum erythrorhizon]|nr:hypothetical protein Leryth_007971 [Lithospermum erythrorhizon]
MNIFPLFILLLLTLAPPTTSTTNDTAALSLFRSQTDVHGTLLSNWTISTTNATACTANWRGISCMHGRVIGVFLSFLSLRGGVDALASLDQLRVLDLHENRLNGTLSPLTHCLNLKLVYLSGNDLSGELPQEISSLRRLRRLDVSNNNLQGPLPTQLSDLPRLITIHLQNNALSGTIPASLDSLQSLKDLNLSNNEFYGNVPPSLLKKFGLHSFLGNQELCEISNIQPCSSSGRPQLESSQSIVPASPSSLPTSSSSVGEQKNYSRKGLSKGAIVAIVVVNSVVLVVLASFVMAYFCGRYESESSSLGGSETGTNKRRSSYSSDKRVYNNNYDITRGVESDATNATDRSKIVFYDRRKQFELEELLRASAEMLGKGSLGTVYKAVLDDGATVAVKRLKDANPCARKEFEQYMDVIGKLKHPNIVKLRAYYYAKEEKLMIYDYMPNGSLHSLLHANRGPGRIPLDWTTRISIMLGAARGLAKIHEEYSESRIPHGNVKSSNVLLDKNGVACISDFGLSLLLNPAHAIARLGGYKAPEQAEIKRLSQKSDVYSFGVLLLEILTGKTPSVYPSPSRPLPEGGEELSVDLPKWVRSVVRDEWTAEVFDQELLRYKNIEEELVAMLHIAMACVVPLPEKRPTMTQVAKMVEEIRVEQSPLGELYDESRNSLSPSVSTNDEAPAAGF